MVREQQVLDLIGNIYDAALDASHWPSVLQNLVRLTHSNTSNLAEIDLADGKTKAIAAVDIAAKGFSDYEAHYWQKDIWTPKPGAFGIGRALISHEHISDRALAHSEIYNDWMKPLGLFYGLGGIPLVEGTRMLLIGVHRPWPGQRAYTHKDARTLQRLFPHLRRALQIHHRLEEATVERAALAEMADQVPRGILTLGTNGRLLWANRTGEALCRQADGLTIQRGSLTTALPAETQRLRQLIHHTVQTGNGGGMSDGGTMLVSRPSGLRPYIVLVSPLRAGRDRLNDRQPAAVVFVSDPERVPDVPLDRLMRLYRLTQAEGRLVQQLAAGYDLKNIAATTQRTMNTLRTQLKQIFQKTGTSRQAQLVRLMLQIEGGAGTAPGRGKGS